MFLVIEEREFSPENELFVNKKAISVNFYYQLN